LDIAAAHSGVERIVQKSLSILVSLLRGLAWPR
jgi:hypothetical protein